MPRRRSFAGVERADSVTIDAHKWLYLPKACGVVLVRAARPTSQAALGHEGAYLPHDREEPHAADITLEYSRPFRALKLWLALRVHGADAFRAAIERNLDQARCSTTRVVERPELQPLAAAPQLSVVPFRHAPPGVADLDAHNTEIVRRLQEGGEFWVAHARIDGSIYIRPCIVNFRTTDADVVAFVEHVERLGQRTRSDERPVEQATPRWHPVGPARDEPDGSLRRIEVDGRAICLGRVSRARWAAFDDTCTHAGVLARRWRARRARSSSAPATARSSTSGPATSSRRPRSSRCRSSRRASRPACSRCG